MSDLKNEILALLGENRLLSLATLRADGWPQNTIVGYVHDGFSIYFAVGRGSQKWANLQRDPRASITMGQDSPTQIRGLSMAARVFEVTDFAEIDRINKLLHTRYPEQAVFAPREASAAILRATPTIISIIDLSKGPGPTRLVTVEPDVVVRAAV